MNFYLYSISQKILTVFLKQGGFNGFPPSFYTCLLLSSQCTQYAHILSYPLFPMLVMGVILLNHAAVMLKQTGWCETVLLTAAERALRFAVVQLKPLVSLPLFLGKGISMLFCKYWCRDHVTVILCSKNVTVLS